MPLTRTGEKEAEEVGRRALLKDGNQGVRHDERARDGEEDVHGPTASLEGAIGPVDCTILAVAVERLVIEVEVVAC